MECGKLTESIYERSIVKVVKTNTITNKKFYEGAGLGADCAALTDSNLTGILSGQAMAFGWDSKVAARAYIASVNHAVACSAGCRGKELSENTFANLTVLVPERLREIKVRAMIQEAALQADRIGIPLLTCNVQVLPVVEEPMAVCTVNAGFADSEVSQMRTKNSVQADKEIVMTKWIGLEGTAVIADQSGEILRRRYPSNIVSEAADFYQYLSVAAEAACAVKSGANYLHVPREGGIFGGLWQLAAENGVGLVIDLKKIPVRQETIEVCEFFDLNPYELLAGGCLLIITDNGSALVRALKEAGISSAVIGRTTQGNDRMICHEEEVRYLEPARKDALYAYRLAVEKRNKKGENS